MPLQFLWHIDMISNKIPANVFSTNLNKISSQFLSLAKCYPFVCILSAFSFVFYMRLVLFLGHVVYAFVTDLSTLYASQYGAGGL